jgi:hypothetical protein
MKHIFKKYRVKEINGKFIPQFKSDIFFWDGIDKELNYLWFTKEYQLRYCSFDNLADAQRHILKYKYKIENDKIKYYKIKYYY